MLVFIDESGDPGLKLDQGPSKYFTVSLVVFEENDEALACDQKIELLKRELGWEPKANFILKTIQIELGKLFYKRLPHTTFSTTA